MDFIKALKLFRISIIVIFIIGSLCVFYGFFIESRWLKIRLVQRSNTPSITVIHFSDIHYKGDEQYLKRVISSINKISADIVCFTGDLIESEDIHYLPECLEIISTINKPLYGVGGNHDAWAVGERLSQVKSCFEETGGGWLPNDMAITLSNGSVVFVGESPIDVNEPTKRILLTHYPDAIERLGENSFDLVLAGHTHGGQINIPFLTTTNRSKYHKGLYKHKNGTLYVNPGVGTFFINARFLCRPEIRVIAL